jgi:hypothetical protein
MGNPDPLHDGLIELNHRPPEGGEFGSRLKARLPEEKKA